MKRKGGVSNEISGVALNSLEYMERAHKEGATVLMMIDSRCLTILCPIHTRICSPNHIGLYTKRD